MRLDRNFANGRFIEPAGDELIAVHNPATEDADRAVSGASQAEASGGRRRRGRRSKELAQAALRRRAVYPAQTRRRAHRTPRPPSARRSRWSRARASPMPPTKPSTPAQITRYHAEWARRIEGEVIPSDTARRKPRAASRADRRGRVPDPVQLPGVHVHAQGRARADHRQHGGRAAEQQHADVRVRDREGGRASRPASRRREHPRDEPCDRRSGLHASGGRHDHADRQRRRGPQGARLLQGEHREAVARTRRQDARDHRTGCRSGKGGARTRRVEDHALRPALHGDRTRLRAGERARPLRRAAQAAHERGRNRRSQRDSLA